MVNWARERPVGGCVVFRKDLVEGPYGGICSDNVAWCHNVCETISVQ